MRKTAIVLSAVLLTAGFAGTAAAQEKDNLAMHSTLQQKQASLLLDNADIQGVLRLIAAEYDLNIVMSDEVSGTVSLRLKGASLVNTLDAILLSRGYDYEIQDNIIRVATAETIEAERGKRLSKIDQGSLVPAVITLSYLDATDVQAIVTPLLTERGSVQVLERRAYRGFQFGSGGDSEDSGGGSSGGDSGGTGPGNSAALIRQRDGDDTPRSNTILVVDVISQIEKIREVIRQVDMPPKQILIDTRILEVETGTLEDLGIEFSGEFSYPRNPKPSDNITLGVESGPTSSSVNANALSSLFPTASDGGFHAVFHKLKGEDFDLTLHALLQDDRVKTLSAPKILTIENQEAAILVGEQFPILEANVTDSGTATESLSYFQPVGVSLQVVAQVTPENDVSMIIHPTVSSIGSFVTGSTGLQQPRINIREADTRVYIKNGETLVIGGLLEDITTNREWGVPFLRSLPVLGELLTRRQVNVEQRNLIIFITPSVVDYKESKITEAQQLSYDATNDEANYGYLHQRRQMLQQIYNSARRNYKNSYDNIARAQFLRVLAIDPHHAGAIKYLKEMDALPVEKPI